ncbi:MAG TPA: cupin domain-containing protein [Desulfonatronum sp.]|nr:cupin domain-containing protein [Desulfonatronum sp.]
MANIFDIPAGKADQERCDVLAQGPETRIERIISQGHASPPGFWYDQVQDEWVCLLQGEAQVAWEHGQIQKLVPGDWLFIPAHARHRIVNTSIAPPCIWLAVHGQLGGFGSR